MNGRNAAPPATVVDTGLDRSRKKSGLAVRLVSAGDEVGKSVRATMWARRCLSSVPQQQPIKV